MMTSDLGVQRLLLVLLIWCSCQEGDVLVNAYAFHPKIPASRPLAPLQSTHRHYGPLQVLAARQTKAAATTTCLYFWGNKDKKEKEDNGDDAASDASGEKKEGGDNNDVLKNFLSPFFGSPATPDEPERPKPTPPESSSSSPAPPARRRKVVEETDPLKRAQALRAQAERARLEADRMDAELTLTKVARLEKEIAAAVAKDETDDMARLQQEMDSLQAKIRGEAPKPVVAAAPAKSSSDSSSTSTKTTDKESTTASDLALSSSTTLAESFSSEPMLPFSEEDTTEIAKSLEMTPNFVKKLSAQMLEVDFDTVDDINVTELAVRMEKMKRMDFSYSKRTKPIFTQADIDRAKEELKGDWLSRTQLEESVVDSAKGNDTKLALMTLEYEYYANGGMREEDFTVEQIKKLVSDDDWLVDIIDSVNQTGVDATIESLYPKCTRKEGSPVPTMAQIKLLMSDVLPKASFTPRGQPETVLGGYIVRGSSRLEKGDELIAAIEELLEKSPTLKDKMTVLYTKDFTLMAPQADEDYNSFDTDGPNMDDEPPVLYVMGPDVVVERKRIPLTLTTIVGISTSWYLSVYPFLLNPTIMKRTEEQLALADAGMDYDLGWLTELSLPVFATFLGIQLAHEAGHKVAASASGLTTTLPTFVPSLITGLTSSVTNMKEPPKNKEALFDFAVAGPLAGILASLAALVIGSQLTAVSDPSNFPALPLEILRQSTLGGGIINSILGNGALNVPEGAVGSEAVAGMTVALHPIALAGYIGLIINALALLPIGTTDGGRMGLALYGRASKLIVGNISLLLVFAVGVFGSDLFLFYCAFLLAFQTGNEIPARNEVDNISFPRVTLAIGATVVALLSLIPFQ